MFADSEREKIEIETMAMGGSVGLAAAMYGTSSVASAPFLLLHFESRRLKGLEHAEKKRQHGGCASGRRHSGPLSWFDAVSVGDLQNFDGQVVLSTRTHFKVEARRKPTRTDSAKVLNLRQRKKYNGTAKLPRLSVFRSRKHVFAQLVNDAKKITLVAASTSQLSDFDHMETSLSPIEDAARQVGCEIARRCLELGILKVILDRNGFSGRGGIQALADAVQEHGVMYS